VLGPGIHRLSRDELERALRAAGAKPGDQVTIGDEELTFE
jgi:hypothetical protein